MSEPAPVRILNVDTPVWRVTRRRASIATPVSRWPRHRPVLRRSTSSAPKASPGPAGCTAADINGTEVCKIIKKRWPSTMVLQTSPTFVTSADLIRGLDGGADLYLVQPIDPDELVAAIRALMRLHAAEESVRALNESPEQRTEDLRATNLLRVEQAAQRERAEAALVQSQKREAVGQLTGVMAHDFNNVLAAEQGYLHLVRRRSDSDDVREMKDKALGVVRRPRGRAPGPLRGDGRPGGRRLRRRQRLRQRARDEPASRSACL